MKKLLIALTTFEFSTVSITVVSCFVVFGSLNSSEGKIDLNDYISKKQLGAVDLDFKMIKPDNQTILSYINNTNNIDLQDGDIIIEDNNKSLDNIFNSTKEIKIKAANLNKYSGESEIEFNITNPQKINLTNIEVNNIGDVNLMDGDIKTPPSVEYSVNSLTQIKENMDFFKTLLDANDINEIINDNFEYSYKEPKKNNGNQSLTINLKAKDTSIYFTGNRDVIYNPVIKDKSNKINLATYKKKIGEIDLNYLDCKPSLNQLLEAINKSNSDKPFITEQDIDVTSFNNIIKGTDNVETNIRLKVNDNSSKLFYGEMAFEYSLKNVKKYNITDNFVSKGYSLNKDFQTANIDMQGKGRTPSWDQIAESFISGDNSQTYIVKNFLKQPDKSPSFFIDENDRQYVPGEINNSKPSEDTKVVASATFKVNDKCRYLISGSEITINFQVMNREVFDISTIGETIDLGIFDLNGSNSYPDEMDIKNRFIEKQVGKSWYQDVKDYINDLEVLNRTFNSATLKAFDFAKNLTGSIVVTYTIKNAKKVELKDVILVTDLTIFYIEYNMDKPSDDDLRKKIYDLNKDTIPRSFASNEVAFKDKTDTGCTIFAPDNSNYTGEVYLKYKLTTHTTPLTTVVKNGSIGKIDLLGNKLYPEKSDLLKAIQDTNENIEAKQYLSLSDFEIVSVTNNGAIIRGTGKVFTGDAELKYTLIGVSLKLYASLSDLGTFDLQGNEYAPSLTELVDRINIINNLSGIDAIKTSDVEIEKNSQSDTSVYIISNDQTSEKFKGSKHVLYKYKLKNYKKQNLADLISTNSSIGLIDLNYEKKLPNIQDIIKQLNNSLKLGLNADEYELVPNPTYTSAYFKAKESCEKYYGEASVTYNLINQEIYPYLKDKIKVTNLGVINLNNETAYPNLKQLASAITSANPGINIDETDILFTDDLDSNNKFQSIIDSTEKRFEKGKVKLTYTVINAKSMELKDDLSVFNLGNINKYYEDITVDDIYMKLKELNPFTGITKKDFIIKMIWDDEVIIKGTQGYKGEVNLHFTSKSKKTTSIEKIIDIDQYPFENGVYYTNYLSSGQDQIINLLKSKYNLTRDRDYRLTQDSTQVEDKLIIIINGINNYNGKVTIVVMEK
ncbi:hypothetical protein SCORR_v1c07900 [Spiroplasma corruscae]|uniref:Uncharacterized protein n=1 Tax=Spiroplasma corruscae TaxID=216934 RepID=A0A222EQ34_9MOLU|nr:hypothetical protein [Spiroplasma corruscae]ASP28562.1 hypothetical protein SCORR_v1c07900 [Spiroplasma corruscae]